MTEVQMDFNSADLVVMNAAIALMMFGVSLQLKGEDFSRLLKQPRAPLAGLIAQFLLLPAATCLVTWLFSVPAEFALGMILVASCPGGTFSNVMTWMAKGNVAVSVTMTAVSSLAAVVLTPANFALYGWLNPHTRPLLQQIAIDPVNLLLLVALVLAVPIFSAWRSASAIRTSRHSLSNRCAGSRCCFSSVLLSLRWRKTSPCSLNTLAAFCFW